MKHILLFITLLTGSISFAYAQDDEVDPAKGQERVKALYVAYVTKQLNLNETEAQKFWPLHSQFEADINAVDNNLPELQRQQKVLDIKKNYQDRFTKVLGNSGRTDTFFKLDNEFRRKLADARNRRQQNKANQQRPLRRNN